MLGYGSWVRETILSDSDLLGMSYLLHTRIIHESHVKQIGNTQALNPKFSPSHKKTVNSRREGICTQVFIKYISWIVLYRILHMVIWKYTY